MRGEVRAAGVIPYTVSNGVTYFLMVKTNSKGFGDFGGKIEHNELPHEIAAREAEEESNGIFRMSDVLAKIGTNYIYIPAAKYALFFYPLSELPDPLSFGTRELHTGYPLEVVCCNSANGFNLQLHPRLVTARKLILQELRKRARCERM
ncbi:Hypothetical protein DHA2_150836 [Giardia duodenalis]|nr:Hypothetical protein DHA2_150836 [Giardia intestinalis]